MTLYYCMHFNFFFQVKESMNLSELLIIFVNKVLITQSRGVFVMCGKWNCFHVGHLSLKPNQGHLKRNFMKYPVCDLNLHTC